MNIDKIALEANDLWISDSPDCPTYEDISDAVIAVLNKYNHIPTRMDDPVFQQVLHKLPSDGWTVL